MEELKKNWYDKTYKFILLIPLIILLFSVYYLYNFQQENGDIIYKDVTLTGGTTATVFDGGVDILELKSAIEEDFPDVSIRAISDFRTGRKTGFILETRADSGAIKNALESYLGYELNQDNSSFEFSAAAVSRGFYQQLRYSIFLAFLLMGVVIFLIFRSVVPSAAVIFSAFADIVMAIVVVNILGINLSIAGVIAFLMLIGYSVDTDILLTNRVLRKKENSINERIYAAFKTGMTMTLTSIAAVAIALFIVRGSSDTLAQIFMILLIGLFFDMFNTWLANASIIKWYAEKKEKI